MSERETERQRQTETETGRQRNRQTDRQTERKREGGIRVVQILPPLDTQLLLRSPSNLAKAQV